MLGRQSVRFSVEHGTRQCYAMLTQLLIVVVVVAVVGVVFTFRLNVKPFFLPNDISIFILLIEIYTFCGHRLRQETTKKVQVWELRAGFNKEKVYQGIYFQLFELDWIAKHQFGSDRRPRIIRSVFSKEIGSTQHFTQRTGDKNRREQTRGAR